jgi:hypothetical protein
MFKIKENSALSSSETLSNKLQENVQEEDKVSVPGVIFDYKFR